MSQVKGLNVLLKNLKRFGNDTDKEVDIIFASNASEISVDAKQLAPVNFVQLRQSIQFQEVDNLNYSIFSNINYAPYMEYGTGGLVEVPEELKDNAIQFIGKGIKQVNIKPRPFLYPAFIKGRGQIIKDLNQLLKDLTKKYG